MNRQEPWVTYNPSVRPGEAGSEANEMGVPNPARLNRRSRVRVETHDSAARRLTLQSLGEELAASATCLARVGSRIRPSLAQCMCSVLLADALSALGRMLMSKIPTLDSDRSPANNAFGLGVSKKDTIGESRSSRSRGGSDFNASAEYATSSLGFAPMGRICTSTVGEIVVF